MKSFKQYLAEAEMLSQVNENSNLPVANDSTSPINGSKVDYEFANKLRRNPPKPKPHERIQSPGKPLFPTRNS